MSTVASSPDTEAADLLQNLSLDSETKTTGVPEADAKKSGPGQANGVTKPFNPNACFIPNGYPSTAYYYGGYDEQGDWTVYSRYVNFDGGMAQGAFGDSCSYMYHQGYGYTPYGAYPPVTSSSIQNDDQLYGLQRYQYPYFQSPSSANGSFASNKISVPQEKISTEITAEHVPSSVVMNKGSTDSLVNGESTNNDALKEFSTGCQQSSLNSYDSCQRAGFPAQVSLSGYQGPRMSTHETQPASPSDASLCSDKQSKHGAEVGLSLPAVPSKDFSSQRNRSLSQPLPQFTNLHGSIHSSGREQVSRFMNMIYPTNMMYSQYGNTYRASSRFGSASYGSRTESFGNKFKVGRVVDHVKKNMDNFGELNKGPRAANSSDDKSVKDLGPVTLLLKGQNLPMSSENKEVPLVPNKEQYNGDNFSDNYSDAKFFVIKSYSEDDIHKSIKYGVWTSTPNGNKKLDAAYQEAKEKPSGCPVFLLFSVNTSGQFVGMAEMAGPVDFGRTVEHWQQDRWTGCFSVKWHIIKDIPNSVLRHITLENNENRPVTNSRDTQEVKFEKGIQILKIFKEHSSRTCILDDFGFYEAREKTIQERKSKEQQFPKQVSKPNDSTTIGTGISPQSLDGTLMNESAAAGAAAGREKLLEGNESTPALEVSTKSC